MHYHVDAWRCCVDEAEMRRYETVFLYISFLKAPDDDRLLSTPRSAEEWEGGGVCLIHS